MLGWDFHDFTKRQTDLFLTKKKLLFRDSYLGGKICFWQEGKTTIDMDRSGMPGWTQNRLQNFPNWQESFLFEVKESHDKSQVLESEIWILTDSFLNRLEELFLHLRILNTRSSSFTIIVYKNSW